MRERMIKRFNAQGPVGDNRAGCWCAHMDALSLIIRRGLRNAIVVESDAVAVAGFDGSKAPRGSATLLGHLVDFAAAEHSAPTAIFSARSMMVMVVSALCATIVGLYIAFRRSSRGQQDGVQLAAARTLDESLATAVHEKVQSQHHVI